MRKNQEYVDGYIAGHQERSEEVPSEIIFTILATSTLWGIAYLIFCYM